MIKDNNLKFDYKEWGSTYDEDAKKPDKTYGMTFK